MNKLYIPNLGDIIELTKPWTFTLYPESRNSSLLTTIIKNFEWCKSKKTGYKVTLPKGTQLKFSRIYIRQGQDDYNSVTFYINDIPSGSIKEKLGKKKARFWAKLEDINTIEYDFVGRKIK